MKRKTCFFIGNRYTPSSIRQQLTEVVEKHITEYGVTTFTVGHYGSFDSFVTEVLSVGNFHKFVKYAQGQEKKGVIKVTLL